jgi:hypothetical protein
MFVFFLTLASLYDFFPNNIRALSSRHKKFLSGLRIFLDYRAWVSRVCIFSLLWSLLMIFFSNSIRAFPSRHLLHWTNSWKYKILMKGREDYIQLIQAIIQKRKLIRYLISTRYSPSLCFFLSSEILSNQPILHVSDTWLSSRLAIKQVVLNI